MAMADDALNTIHPKRPDFKKDSVVFGAITGVALGAAIFAALFAGIPAVGQLFKAQGSRIPLKEIWQNEGHVIMAGAIAMGIVGGSAAKARNIRIEETKPYVEKLEQQRDALIAAQAETSPGR